MPSLSAYSVFLATAIVLLLIPGPAVLYVVTRSIEMGRAGGIASVAGITTGTVAYVTLAAVGLSSLILASTAAFDAVKYVGAAYLFVLGVRRLLGRGLEQPDEAAVPRTRRRAYAQGVFVNLTNPKTIVFVFAFLPQFVDPHAPHAWVQVLALGLSFALLGFLSDSMWALAAGTVADRLRGSYGDRPRPALGRRRRARRPRHPRRGVDAEPGTVTIRDLRPEDWPAVREIYEEGIRGGDATFETETPTWERWDAAHPDLRLVAERDGVVVGWAALSPASARRCYRGVGEVSVYVAEAARGAGLGRALLDELVGRSEQAGYWTLTAGVFPENEASVRLHRACGFREVGVRERIGEAAGVWRDVILLERRSAVVG